MAELLIEAVGAVTAVGRNAATTMGSLLTNTQLFSELDVVDEAGEPLMGAAVPIDRGISRARRLGLLGLLALRDAATRLDRLPPVPAVVCGPADGAFSSEADLLNAVAADASLPLDRRSSVAVLGNRDAGIDAVKMATSKAAGAAGACWFVGLDSLIHEAGVRRLQETGLLRTAANPAGLVPGEAAAAVLLTSRRSRRCARLIGFNAATEPAGMTAPSGIGLSRATQAAFAGGVARPAEVGGIVDDTGGLRSHFEELALCDSRPPLASIGDHRRFIPAMSTGEIGAASAALSIAALAFFLTENVVKVSGLCRMFGADRGRAAALIAGPGDR